MAAPGITVNIRDGIVIVDPSDRKNLCDTEDGLPQLVRSLADEGFRKFVLNLRRVPYIDSTGLGCIARAALTVAHRDGQLKLLNAGERIRDLLRVTRLASVFEIFESEDEAIRSFTAHM